MSGSRRCLVTVASATSCLRPGASSDHSIAIERAHSDLVKFAPYDAEYNKVSHVLEKIYQRSLRLASPPTAAPSPSLDSIYGRGAQSNNSPQMNLHLDRHSNVTINSGTDQQAGEGQGFRNDKEG